MAVSKLSAIASSGANLTATDTLIGVHGGNTDFQFTGAQILAYINANASFPTAANPTATIGTAAVNGVATTFMRSDAAPAFGNLTGDVTSVGMVSTLATTQPGAHTWSANGAASTPADLYSGTWFTGGSATTTKPQVLIEPAGTSSTTWSTSGTGLGVNAASGFAGDLLSLKIAGVTKFYVTDGVYGSYVGGTGLRLTDTSVASYSGFSSHFVLAATGNPGVNIKAQYYYGWSPSGNADNAPDVILGRGAPATLQLGAANAASPVNQTVQAQGSRAGTDSNVGGGNLSIGSGIGTGTGALSVLNLQSPIAVAGGTGAQTQTTGASIKNGYVKLVSYTTAALPATPDDGALALVTDATLTAITGLGLAPTGGGANKVVVYGAGGGWLML